MTMTSLSGNESISKEHC